MPYSVLVAHNLVLCMQTQSVTLIIHMYIESLTLAYASTNARVLFS